MTPSAALLAVLRSGQPLPEALAAQGMTADAFQAALAEYLRAKLPSLSGKERAGVDSPACILRDRYGVPHIRAANAHDLFFAYGYATAQDRLWQLDYLRRAAHGRLAEILGPEALANDIETRTVGIGRLAHDLVRQLPGDTVECLIAFAEGINTVIELCHDNLPLEFDVLKYSCEPWRVADTLALMKHFWWQLTGRLFLITGPELLRQHLQNDALFEAFLRSEVRGESILPPGENRAEPLPAPFELAGGDAPPGSNNWVIGPGKSATGSCLFASDPHTPYGAPTVWYEVHLDGAGYATAGMSYVGIPGIVFGRNRQGAWGITNNICSLRDLFIYPPGDPAIRNDPRPECILVRGATEHVFPLARTELGPIVNHLLPAGIREGPPVALRWVGTDVSDEIGCMLRLNRAGGVEDFRAALAGWTCPTFNFVWADRGGNIAYQCAGRLPRRLTSGRGLRLAHDPEQHWAGSIPFACNPWTVNPAQGWIGTANNPVLPATEDPGLGGMWTSDARARRIRTKLEGQATFTLPECAAFQTDTVSERVIDVQRALTASLAASADGIHAARELLANWDGDLSADSTAAALFEAFSRHWTATVLAARDVPEPVRDLLTRHVLGIAFALLCGDSAGWFGTDDASEHIRTAMRKAIDDLTTRLGADPAQWRWGALHTITLRHPLGKRGLLGGILDTGPRPIGGASHTVNNQWVNASGSYEATAGPNCRVAADLGTDELLVTSCLGQSGHPGSSHYRDQIDDWLSGRQHVLSLDWAKVEASAPHRLDLEP
jgi:penicillin amidase